MNYVAMHLLKIIFTGLIHRAQVLLNSLVFS